ncbi:MAG: response regulator [Deltaproteobacteria bacterium]|jgi:signal transduction histidine kinase/CheY-like chemotaxis protein|nr:response regulator [Deltaproteobacteria bacterium]
MTNSNNEINDCTELAELAELRQEVVYLRRICENSLGRLLLADTQGIAIRHELEQKRRGMSLMADLAMALRPGSDYESAFTSVSRRINAALSMQRTAVLVREPDGLFRVSILQGYEAQEQADLTDKRLLIDEASLHPQSPILITGADPDSRMADLRQALALPYLIACPVRLHDKIVAILVTGRLIESPPFLPRLTSSDLETVQTVSAYLAAMLTGQLLEKEEAQKRDLEEIMQTVFRASLDGYLVWDSGRMERISPGALKLLELESSEEFLENYSAYGLTEAHLNGAYRRVLTEGRFREELLLRTKSGQLAPCELTYLPLNLRHTSCLLSYVRDLREQKKNEEALLLAKEQAEVAAKAKSAFLANMSHEIRTPMNAIAGLAHLIYDDNLNQIQKDYLAQIEDSFKSLLRIVNDVLEYSTMTARKMTLETTVFRLDEALAAVIRGNQPPAAAKGLRLILAEPAPADLYLTGDPVRLKQILNILLDNAVKFTYKGEVTVAVTEVGRSQGASGQGQVTFQFAVTDTGIGFPPEEATKLFSAFSQQDNSSTRIFGGTGLGLAIAKELVEMMGGEIRAQGQPGQGSVFSFTARFLLARPVDLDKGQTLQAKASELRENFQGARILLVEDNKVNQLVARKLLEKAGIVVTIADNGLKALEKVKAQEFDLVLMDIQMPEMDGLEATRQIRSQAEFATLPILAMTAHALSDDRELSFKAGMNGHLTKPINVKELFVTLGEWISAK